MQIIDYWLFMLFFRVCLLLFSVIFTSIGRISIFLCKQNFINGQIKSYFLQTKKNTEASETENE